MESHIVFRKSNFINLMINLKPFLETNNIILNPLTEEDFNELYLAASDPKIWEQHPNKDRWKRDVFRNFFEGAMKSGGAFKIIDKATSKIIGSTRFYDYNADDKSILIGYTFFKVSHWGKGFNREVKELMLAYIFQFVSQVDFHVGAENHRSLISIARIGAIKVGEQEVTYFGEEPKLNAIFRILTHPSPQTIEA